MRNRLPDTICIQPHPEGQGHRPICPRRWNTRRIKETLAASTKQNAIRGSRTPRTDVNGIRGQAGTESTRIQKVHERRRQGPERTVLAAISDGTIRHGSGYGGTPAEDPQSLNATGRLSGRRGRRSILRDVEYRREVGALLGAAKGGHGDPQ